MFFSSTYGHPRHLHSFPTRRSSDLTTKIRVNATCRKCPHKVHRMEMKTAISCTILRHTKILDRKSGSAGMPRPTSYAVFCLKKKRHTLPWDQSSRGTPDRPLCGLPGRRQHHVRCHACAPTH